MINEFINEKVPLSGMTQKELMQIAAPCMPSSGKKWPDEIQQAFVQECVSGVGDGVGETEATEYCICVLNVSMQRWNTVGDAYIDIEKMTIRQMNEWVQPCVY